MSRDDTSHDPTAWQARLRQHLAQDAFTLPDLPDWKLERPTVTAYKAQMVRHLRAAAAAHGYTYAQLAEGLDLSPRQARRLLDGYVALHEPDELHRLVLRLDPYATVPGPATIPPMSEAERAEGLARIKKKIDAALADPRPSVPAEEVFAQLKAKSRVWRPLSDLPVQGPLVHGPHVGVYGFDPDAGVYHGEIEILGDLVICQVSTLPDLEAAFAAAIADYAAFCRQVAVPAPVQDRTD